MYVRTSFAQELRSTTDKWEFLKLKSSLQPRKQSKKKPTEEEKILADYISDKTLTYRAQRTKSQGNK